MKPATNSPASISVASPDPYRPEAVHALCVGQGYEFNVDFPFQTTGAVFLMPRLPSGLRVRSFMDSIAVGEGGFPPAIATCQTLVSLSK
ncbi:hypothetical protein IE4872_PD01573 (plasmid) [Rhizobium gallicum]|uniref:Uncharacterized protein n=1 Tax=Rhizobium gallicum TaxID=56730 RepID=A0A1L5NW32_9HYPH|nr:hypothetical protein IE4872_PD01573 [Rhizobium gallicum]